MKQARNGNSKQINQSDIYTPTLLRSMTNDLINGKLASNYDKSIDPYFVPYLQEAKRDAILKGDHNKERKINTILTFLSLNPQPNSTKPIRKKTKHGTTTLKNDKNNNINSDCVEITNKYINDEIYLKDVDKNLIPAICKCVKSKRISAANNQQYELAEKLNKKLEFAQNYRKSLSKRSKNANRPEYVAALKNHLNQAIAAKQKIQNDYENQIKRLNISQMQAESEIHSEYKGTEAKLEKEEEACKNYERFQPSKKILDLQKHEKKLSQSLLFKEAQQTNQKWKELEINEKKRFLDHGLESIKNKKSELDRTKKRRYLAVNQFFNEKRLVLKQKYDESIKQHDDNIEAIISRLQDLGEEIPEEILLSLKPTKQTTNDNITKTTESKPRANQNILDKSEEPCDNMNADEAIENNVSKTVEMPQNESLNSKDKFNPSILSFDYNDVSGEYSISNQNSTNNIAGDNQLKANLDEDEFTKVKNLMQFKLDKNKNDSSNINKNALNDTPKQNGLNSVNQSNCKQDNDQNPSTIPSTKSCKSNLDRNHDQKDVTQPSELNSNLPINPENENNDHVKTTTEETQPSSLIQETSKKQPSNNQKEQRNDKQQRKTDQKNKTKGKMYTPNKTRTDTYKNSSNGSPSKRNKEYDDLLNQMNLVLNYSDDSDSQKHHTSKRNMNITFSGLPKDQTEKEIKDDDHYRNNSKMNIPKLTLIRRKYEYEVLPITIKQTKGNPKTKNTISKITNQLKTVQLEKENTPIDGELQEQSISIVATDKSNPKGDLLIKIESPTKSQQQSNLNKSSTNDDAIQNSSLNQKEQFLHETDHKYNNGNKKTGLETNSKDMEKIYSMINQRNSKDHSSTKTTSADMNRIFELIKIGQHTSNEKVTNSKHLTIKEDMTIETNKNTSKNQITRDIRYSPKSPLTASVESKTNIPTKSRNRLCYDEYLRASPQSTEKHIKSNTKNHNSTAQYSYDSDQMLSSTSSYLSNTDYQNDYNTANYYDTLSTTANTNNYNETDTYYDYSRENTQHQTQITSYNYSSPNEIKRPKYIIYRYMQQYSSYSDDENHTEIFSSLPIDESTTNEYSEIQIKQWRSKVDFDTETESEL